VTLARQPHLQGVGTRENELASLELVREPPELGEDFETLEMLVEWDKLHDEYGGIPRFLKVR
jgi:hypothetical protein